MSKATKLMGLAAGVSAVAVLGVAIAQGVPPNPYLANPALGAGQQSTHLTSMGETGVPGFAQQPAMAAVAAQPVPMAAAAPEPMPVAQYRAQEPAPLIAESAPEQQPQYQQPAQETVAYLPARPDRN